ncbi:MAG: ATP-binding cassette domain-containing protein, partial [Planctomycetes bacterium]|nr:ATP-binding cassette domain-containing protein [Planctomycetota bacterium]
MIAEFVDVHRHYKMGQNVVRALNGVSMQVRRGDYLTIMGRSGSGKSTMLNLLGCLDRPTTGEYRVGGRDVSKLSDDALSDVRGTEIGFIFQSFNLIPQLTVLENLEVP